MLLVLKVEGLEKLCLKDMEAGKEVKVKGTVAGMYFDENYIEELKEKAKKYDELMDLGERIAESMSSSTGEKEAKQIYFEILKAFSKLVFLGHNIKPRKSFADEIEYTKYDIRIIAKKGIYYRDKIYTFDGWENHIGEIINFEVFDDYLLLNLEGQALYATTQDI